MTITTEEAELHRNQIEEVYLLRLAAERNAERNARFKAEAEFSHMQRRIARQRRALAKLYKRRHGRKAENARLREALDFYSDISKYPAPLTGGMGALWEDCGKIARAAPGETQ